MLPEFVLIKVKNKSCVFNVFLLMFQWILKHGIEKSIVRNRHRNVGIEIGTGSKDFKQYPALPITLPMRTHA